MKRTRTVPRGSRLPHLLAAALAAALLSLAPASAAAAGWVGLSPVAGDPGGGRSMTGLELAADAAGNQVAVWIEQPSPFKVQAAFRPAGGAWGPAQTLDSTATTLPVTDLAVDPAGNFIVLYTQVIGTTKKVFSSYLPAGTGSFGAPQQFGNTLLGATTLTGIAVALDGKGQAYAVHGIAGSVGIGGYRPAGAGSAWTLASTGLPTNSGNEIDMAASASGVPTLADYPGAGGALRHTRFDGASWVTITTPAGVGNATGALAIRVDSQGRTTTLYQVASTTTQLATQACPPGVTAPTQCSPRFTFATILVSANTSSPALGVSGGGDGAAAWLELCGACTTPVVAVSQRSGFGGAWSAPTQIGNGAAPGIGFRSSGEPLVLHEQTPTRVNFLTAAAGALLGGTSTTITDTSQAWTAPALAFDGGGNAFGAWLGAGGSAIQSGTYDAEPPTITAMSAPAGVAGRALAISATASDKWSAVSYSWDLGDGTQAAGQSVSHTYASAGTYTARVTARDGAGNEATRSEVVTIAAAQAQPPPTGLPRPVAGQTVNVEPVSGVVTVKSPGSDRFVPLVAPTQVSQRAIVDARRGRVRITIDNGLGGYDTAEFYGGMFRFTQPPVAPGRRRVANLHLYGGSFRGCPRAPRKPRIAGAAAGGSKRSAGRSVRRLWGEGQGAFRTVGRFSSATIRGTTWLVDDKCNATLTRVTVGKVGVRDFVRRRTIVVLAGKRYLARPRPRR